MVQAAFSDGLLWVGFRQFANGFLFFNYFYLLLFIQALRLVALSLTLSHGREDGVAVGMKASAKKISCAGCFSVALPYFFPLITFIISIKCGFSSANSGLSLFSIITSPISFSPTAKRCAISGVKPSRSCMRPMMSKMLSWLGASKVKGAVNTGGRLCRRCVLK